MTDGGRALLTAQRVIEIYDPHGGAVGSGYLLAPRLVLTARHVVADALPGEGPVSPPGRSVTNQAVWDLARHRPRCRVRALERTGRSTFSDAVVVWWAMHADAALLVTVDHSVPADYATNIPMWADLPSADPVEVTAVGFPDADVNAKVRESRQIKGVVTPLSGVKRDQWVIQVDGTIGDGARDSGSAWAGMSGAALFAEDQLVGIVAVDAAPQDLQRMQLWAVPARTFAADPGLAEWVRWSTKTHTWARSPVDPIGQHRLLRQVVDANQRLPVLDAESTEKIALALRTLRTGRGGQEATRRAVGHVLAVMSSKNVFHVGLENEVWGAVFNSLRGLRSDLEDAYTELAVTGPDTVRAVIDAMLTTVRNYLGRHETSFMRHMHRAESWHAQWDWPGLPRASLELLALRESLAALIEPLNRYVSRDRQSTHRSWLGYLSHFINGFNQNRPDGEYYISLADAYLNFPVGAAASGAPRLSMNILSAALQENLPSVRMAAFEEIGHLATEGNEEASTVVLDLLTSRDSTLQKRAQLTLQRLPQHVITSRHIPRLAPLVLNPEPLIREAALRLLTPFAALPSVEPVFVAAIACGVEFDAAAVLQALSASSCAARWLTLAADRPAFSTLRELFDDPDPVVRRAVLAKLAGGDDFGNIDAILHVSLSRGGSWRPHSDGGNRQPADAPIADLLSTALSDRNASVRYAAVRATWICLELEESTALLARALRDQHGAVRARAVSTLGLTPRPANVESVLPFARTDTDQRVRAAAVGALHELARSGAPLPGAPIWTMVYDPENEVSGRAKGLLKWLRSHADYGDSTDTWTRRQPRND
ncbi:HEAT repeat domain-containing protein [Streptomyces olivoreticuli]